MKARNYVPLFFVCLILEASNAFAQSEIITTYAGPQMPIDGGLAVDHAFDYVTNALNDGLINTFVRTVKSMDIHCLST
jgi:hypothetical protein